MNTIERVKSILSAEAEAIAAIPVNESVEQSVDTLFNCKGKVFTTGIGKAGYIAKKAASTFCTTGTPSIFIHPGDASHGDVGVVQDGDVLIAYSNSGKTIEVLSLIDFCRNLGISSVISICSSKSSPMGEKSDIVLELGKIVEPCPLGLTPSASTAAMAAISDALALTIMERLEFTPADFAARHHGGYLGVVSRGEK